VQHPGVFAFEILRRSFCYFANDGYAAAHVHSLSSPRISTVFGKTKSVRDPNFIMPKRSPHSTRRLPLPTDDAPRKNSCNLRAFNGDLLA
jgi:hypothetical protein